MRADAPDSLSSQGIAVKARGARARGRAPAPYKTCSQREPALPVAPGACGGEVFAPGEQARELILDRTAHRRAYFDSPYYVYPDGPIAVEALRVIGAAMAAAGVGGIGRSRRRDGSRISCDRRPNGRCRFS